MTLFGLTVQLGHTWPFRIGELKKTELQRGEVTLPVTAGLPNPALTLQLKKVLGRDGK